MPLEKQQAAKTIFLTGTCYRMRQSQSWNIIRDGMWNDESYDILRYFCDGIIMISVNIVTIELDFSTLN